MEKQWDSYLHKSNIGSTNSLFRGLFFQSLDGVCVLDVHGNILLANPSIGRLLGYKSEQLEKMNIEGLGSTHKENLRLSQFCSDSQVGDHCEFETMYLHQNGTSIPVRVNAGMVSFGETSGIVIVAKDISLLKQRETELWHFNKMQSIGQLAGGIAHDFNSTLGGIMGYADLAIEDAEDGSLQRDNLDKLLQAAERAKKLVNQILTFSKSSSSKKDAVPLVPLLKEVIQFLRVSIPSSVSIEASFENTTLPVVGDVAKIHELLINLVTNAVHAMCEQGVLQIILKQVNFENSFCGVVGDSPPGDYALIEVKDNGCGIEPSILNMIFEPFFSTKLPDEGTGMGLSVVYGVVRSHNGNIRIQSIFTQGTTVQIYLPVVPILIVKSPSFYPLTVGGNETILVVDDDPIMADICTKLLQSLGYQVIPTMDVNDALDFLQDKSVHLDVLLTDQTMPQMRGSELASRAMQIRPGLPVILCSGYSASMDEKTAKELGIAKYIQKPVRKRALDKAIRDVLKKHSQTP